MKMKNMLAMLLAVVTSLGVFAACGSSDAGAGTTSTTATPAPATEAPANSEGDDAAASEEAAQATETPIIRMGTNAAFPPFEYVTNNGLSGKYSGVDVAIAMEIAKAMNRELQVNDMEFGSILAALSTGNVDFAAAGMTATEERAQSVDFSVPYFNAIQNIVVMAGNTDIASANDIIENKSVGVVQGYTGEKACIDLKVKNIMVYKSGMEAIADLKAGRLDAVVIDSHTAVAMATLNSDIKVIEDNENFADEFYAIAVQKGNQELLDQINAVLQDLIDSGKIDEFVKEYSSATIEEQ